MTRKPPNPKAYNRRKTPRWEEMPPPGCFVCGKAYEQKGLLGGRPPNIPAARRETKQPVPQVVPARATGPQVQGRAGPGRSRRSETPQDAIT